MISVTLDLSSQGWSAGINGLIAGLFLLLPPLKRWYFSKPEDYQTSYRGIFSILVAVAFIGGSCAGFWDNVACTKTDVLSFMGNVVIASIGGFSASGAVLHVNSTVQTRKSILMGREILQKPFAKEAAKRQANKE